MEELKKARDEDIESLLDDLSNVSTKADQAAGALLRVRGRLVTGGEVVGGLETADALVGSLHESITDLDSKMSRVMALQEAVDTWEKAPKTYTPRRKMRKCAGCEVSSKSFLCDDCLEQLKRVAPDNEDIHYSWLRSALRRAAGLDPDEPMSDGEEEAGLEVLPTDDDELDADVSNNYSSPQLPAGSSPLWLPGRKR